LGAAQANLPDEPAIGQRIIGDRRFAPESFLVERVVDSAIVESRRFPTHIASVLPHAAVDGATIQDGAIPFSLHGK
jgi:hypothetical protein